MPKAMSVVMKCDSHDVNQLILLVLPSARRYAHALMRKHRQYETTADELINDTIVRAISKFHKFTPGTNFQYWFNTIMHNLLINKIRKQTRQNAEHIPIHLTQEIPHMTTAKPDARVIVDDLRRGLERLSPEQREIILLASNGPSYEDMARQTGLLLGTVRSRLSRGRHALRQSMNGESQ